MTFRTRDRGYQIFVSEIMLQQTQADRVISKFLEWMKRYPDWRSVAESSHADLIHAWAGLGYNRRVLYLKRAAQQVIEHGEPTTEQEWKNLPGVGPYTAAALTEFINHKRAVVIDTNVRRVAGRALLGIPHPRLDNDKHLYQTLQKATPYRGHHWNIPQAWMDLGSSICLPRTPKCTQCPLRLKCKAAHIFLTNKPSAKRHIRAPKERKHFNKPFPDRIYRGRILAWIRIHGPTRLSKLGSQIDDSFSEIADSAWLRRMVDRLIRDELLIQHDGDMLNLPYS
jgi:A/G-specific adenine glycosylase